MDSGSGLKVEDMVSNLPEHWTIVQISCYNSLKFSRFKETKKEPGLKEGNPSLCIIRVCNDGQGPQLRCAYPSSNGDAIPYLLELQNILKEA